MPKITSRIVASRKGLPQDKPYFCLQLFGPDGRLKDERIASNLITNVGLDLAVAYLFRGMNPTDQPNPIGYLALGTNNTAATPADVGLGTELVREALETWTTGGYGNIVVSTTFAAGVGTGAITECGLWNDPVAGIIFDRSVFAVVNKEAGDTLKVAYSITLSNG